MDECRCDGFARSVEDCGECAMRLAVVDAAGRVLVRETERILAFRASVSISTRREVG